MDRRVLPPRSARTAALTVLMSDGLSDDDSPPEVISIDDVANCADSNADEETEEMVSNEADDSVDEYLDAEDLQRFASDGSSESDEEIDGSQRGDEEVPTFNTRTGRIWSEDAIRTGRLPVRNVFTGNRGFRRGLRPETRGEAFMVLFENVIDLVVRYTNLHGRRVNAAKWKTTTTSEINAFLGLHILAGVFKAHHRHARELWTVRDGHPLFAATMSYERFSQLRSALRFDDRLRRDKSDRLAPIRSVVDCCNAILSTIYEPGPFLVVDEMLIEFHGAVSFKQFIPTKPGKFGIKVYWIVDNDNTMPLKCIIYFGENTLERQHNYPSQSEAIVMTLAEKYLGRGRNITGRVRT